MSWMPLLIPLVSFWTHPPIYCTKITQPPLLCQILSDAHHLCIPPYGISLHKFKRVSPLKKFSNHLNRDLDVNAHVRKGLIYIFNPGSRILEQTYQVDSMGPHQPAAPMPTFSTSMIAAAFLPASRGLTAGDDETSASGEFKMREAAPSYVFRLLVTAAKASRSVGPTAVFCGSDPGCREWYEVGGEVGPSVIRIFVVGSH